jgi:hypothetical protein
MTNIIKELKERNQYLSEKNEKLENEIQEQKEWLKGTNDLTNKVEKIKLAVERYEREVFNLEDMSSLWRGKLIKEGTERSLLSDALSE